METNSLLNSEYNVLYAEVDANADKVYRILSFCIASTVALLGAVFAALSARYGQEERSLIELQTVAPFLFLFPFVFIYPSMQLVLSSYRSTVRIASYLIVFFEAEQEHGVRWQTRLQELRLRERREKDAKRNAMVLGGNEGDCPRRSWLGSLKAVFDVLVGVCVLLSVLACLIPLISSVPGDFCCFPQQVSWAIPFLIILLLAMFLYYNARRKLVTEMSAENFGDMIEYWKKIQSEESKELEG